ncbi:MAG: sulfatase [Solirubrobacterales bacterium]|nr:sulfatase [Solirubrobacterales bacterium]
MIRDNLAQSAAFLLLLALLSAAASGRASAAPAARAEGVSAQRPNVVVIQTDDQDLLSLRSKFRDPYDRIRRTMPKTLDLIAAQGIEFTNYYVSHPVCAPSRATLLSGQYAHTSGFKKNSGPTGGWEGWRSLPIYNENLAVALSRAGYWTAHVGKFTNNYHGATADTVDTTVPPGWNHWFSPAYGEKLYYYGTRLNVDGVAEGPFGDNRYDVGGIGKDPPECRAANLVDPVPGVECDHSTDMFSRDAVAQIERSTDQPFYLQVDYNTPHGDHRSPAGPEPLARHYDTALRATMPRMTGYNEADVSDKPSFIREVPRLTSQQATQIETRWRKETESLRGVDDGVGAIIEALRRTGKLKNTYVMFVSDNGYFHGQHRLDSAKFLPHEPAAHVPLLIRGPGIAKGSRSGEIVANVDIAPTVLSLTGAKLSRGFDGRTMRPFWTNTKKRTRRPIVLESYVGPDEPAGEASTSAPAPPRNFSGIRAGRYKYVEYVNGERELYDLKTDRAELHNRIMSPAWRPVATRLAYLLNRWKNCRGAACRATVNPLPPPPGKTGKASRR